MKIDDELTDHDPYRRARQTERGTVEVTASRADREFKASVDNSAHGLRQQGCTVVAVRYSGDGLTAWIDWESET